MVYTICFSALPRTGQPQFFRSPNDPALTSATTGPILQSGPGPRVSRQATPLVGKASFDAYDLLHHPVWVVSLTRFLPVYANTAALRLIGCPSVTDWGRLALPCLPAVWLIALGYDPQSKQPSPPPDHGSARQQDPMAVLPSPGVLYLEKTGCDLSLPTPNPTEIRDQAPLSILTQVRCQGRSVTLDDGTPALIVEGTAHPLGSGSTIHPYQAEQALAHTALMVSVFDLKGTLLYQNGAAAAAYGADPTVLGAFLNRLHHASEGVQTWSAIQQGRPYRTEIQVRTTHGLRWHALEARLTPAIDDTHPTLVVITEHDISDHLQIQQSLRKTVERLVQANHEMEQLTWITSHDLREPLRTVISYSTLLERHLGPQLDAHSRDYLQFIVQGAKRMDAQTRDLLHYASLGQNSTPRAAVALTPLLASVVAERRPMLEACGAQVNLAPLPTVQGIASELKILFANLLDNALAYRKADTPLRIQVLAEQEPHSWLIAVIDNGQGIAPQHFERIFQIFQRLHPERTDSGTGVGLALCAKVAEHHGGRIWVESQEGRGAAFFVSLPLVAETPEDTPASGLTARSQS